MTWHLSLKEPHSIFIGFAHKNLAVQGGDVRAEGAAFLALTSHLFDCDWLEVGKLYKLNR